MPFSARKMLTRLGLGAACVSMSRNFRHLASEEPAIDIALANLTRHPFAADGADKLAAVQGIAATLTSLAPLRCVDALETHFIEAHPQAVTIDGPRPATNIGGEGVALTQPVPPTEKDHDCGHG